MDVKSRKLEQSEATRGALLTAARALFAERGYADTATEEVVRRAGVTRGALYHHFRDKQDLFRAVVDDMEREFLEQLAAAAPAGGPWETLHQGFQMFLDASLEPAMQRIVLQDAPSVLGWQEYRAIEEKYSLGVLEAVLGAAIAQGIIEEQPVKPMARLLLSALREAGLLVATADDVPAARRETGESLRRLLDGLRVSPS
jgi:AcrR family transcriptional regulator